MPAIMGAVERIVFHNTDTGYTVARFHLTEVAGRGEHAITIVGTLPTIRAGEMLRLSGEWQVHPVHGRNFQVSAFEPALPESPEGIERYLASGAIRGVGPVTAERIVEHFGAQTLEVIDLHPELLEQVAGISAKRVDIIRESWAEQKDVRDIMMLLQQYDISVALAARLYSAYGRDALRIIREDPFRLAHEVHGVGFKTADALARQLGMPLHSVPRYIAGLRHVLSLAADDGHVFLQRSDLLDRSLKLLQAERPLLETALLEMVRGEAAIVDGEAIYLAPFYQAENGAARLLRQLLESPSPLLMRRDVDAISVVRAAGAGQGLELAEQQEAAAVQALTQKVSILTGGPGTGKTLTLRTIIDALEHLDVTYCQCAPTGRAAKRVTEATGRSASTIHRLLEYQPASNTFGYDRNRPLPFEFVIVDEVSMLDLLLFYHLLKAIPPESHVLFVGDADQLPSVGAGNVLRDLLESGAIPTTRLTRLFRQAHGSQIVSSAHLVNQGTIPPILNRETDDLYFVHVDREEQALEAVKRLVTERIPARFGLDPIEDVQVISPVHSGVSGVASLNRELQASLNPPEPRKPELRRGERIFRLGDKVMQIRNDYEREVFNGDVGRVVDIDPDDRLCLVEFVTAGVVQEVVYDSTDVDELALAYAVSVHKAQGSEFPCVVMLLLPRHYMLLQRNVLYTGLTRARQLCVLVGSERALQTAVEADRRQQRQTALRRRLENDRSNLAGAALL